jgi:hypothetical protein
MGESRCIRHSFELSENACRNCGNEFCRECLVYAFGPKKPPYCVPCALAASGVRSNAANRPIMSKREIRKRNKLRQREAAPQPALVGGDLGPQIDWSIPEGSSSDFDWADSPAVPAVPSDMTAGRVVSF